MKYKFTSVSTTNENPWVWVLASLVDSYDEQTGQVSLVSINAARALLHLPPIRLRGDHR